MSKEEVFEIVKENVIDILPDVNEQDIHPEECLKNLGANSIDRMEITVSCMKSLSLKIPLIEFGSVSNIQGLVDVLYANV